MGGQKEKWRLKSGGRPKWCGRSARKVEAKKKGMLEKFEGDKKVWEAEEVGRPK